MTMILKHKPLRIKKSESRVLETDTMLQAVGSVLSLIPFEVGHNTPPRNGLLDWDSAHSNNDGA